MYKEATLYYVENFQQENERFTPVEEYGYKEAVAGSTVTYSYSIDGDAHKLAACFDACKVTEIKIYDKTPEESVIKGNWTKGTVSELTLETGNQDYWFSGNEDSIYVFNFSLKGYRSPTVEVTAQYDTVPADNSYMQAELYSKEQKIGGAYIPVALGTHKYTFDVSDSLTEFNVCFDGCTVKEIKIYDNRSPIPAEVSGNTASQLASKMGKAWNLGNALDSTDNGTVGETLWNNPAVNQGLFNAVKAAGFDTVRIPVSFMDKIVLENGKYTVDDTYMARVKQVVDVAIAAGLYVVIDVHNDGGDGVQGKWIDISLTEGEARTTMLTKFSDVWFDIADTFKRYDQHLLFESMNEVKISGQNTASTVAYENINALNQAFVTAVRNAGDKNADRVLIIPGYNTDINETIDSDFAKPNDTTNNRLMLSVHYYNPSDFTLNENGTNLWGTEDDKTDMENQMFIISLFADDIGMPIFLGEYGAVKKNNISTIANYCYYLNYYAKDQNVAIVTSYWDNGYDGLNGFALFDRATKTATETGSTIINSIMSK